MDEDQIYLGNIYLVIWMTRNVFFMTLHITIPHKKYAEKPTCPPPPHYLYIWLFETWVFADLIELRWDQDEVIRVGPSSIWLVNITGICIRCGNVDTGQTLREGRELRDTEAGHRVMTMAEIGIMSLHAKDCQWPPDAVKVQGSILPQVSEGTALLTLQF